MPANDEPTPVELALGLLREAGPLNPKPALDLLGQIPIARSLDHHFGAEAAPRGLVEHSGSSS
jgi:hypothetical protein